MGLTISSSGNLSSITRPGSSARSNVGSLSSRLSVAEASSSRSSSGTVSLSADKLAARSATLKLSAGATSINTREALTESQSDTVNELLEKAREIKREASPTRAASLASDAQSLISSASTQYSRALADDSNLSSDEQVEVTVNSDAPVGNSNRSFRTTISGVSSLASLGVSSNLSFSKANIDDTISTLEAAQSSLSTSLSGYASSRSDISAEVSARATDAQLVDSSAGSESVEQVAQRLASEITSSTERLVASGNVEKLDVEALLSEETKKESSDTTDQTAAAA